jgi:Zn-dependent oligopeptidase
LKYKADKTLDTGDLWRTIEEKIENIYDIPGVNPVGHFGHLMSGYVSAYYSYLWSEVYSADLFSIFEKEGLFNKELGMRYRKTILAPGGSVDSIDNVKKFLGRDPNDKAFLKSKGFNVTD